MGRYSSEAHAQIAEAVSLGLTTQSKLARRWGVTQPFVSGLCSGAKTAGMDLRLQIADDPEFAIDVEAWDTPAGVAESKSPAVDETSDPFAQPALVVPDFTAPGSALAELQAQAERLRQSIHAASNPLRPVDAMSRHRLESEYRKTLNDLARLQRELSPVDESRLCKTATFLRLVDQLRDALRPWPEARLAAIAALEANGHTE